MTAIRLWWRLLRRQDSARLTIMLALIAFATATGALLTVLGGLGAFTDRGGNELYVMLAQAATVILIIPVFTLGGAAARLSISRRDERLAALRLAGATGGQVGVIAIADAASQALVGAVGGVVLYLAALPGVAMINFQGRAFTWSELWVGPGVLTAAVAAVVLLAAVSAVISLARIVVSPLGVARRTSPARVRTIRIVVAVAVLAAWAPVTQIFKTGAQLTVIMVVFAACFGVLNLIGPLVLALIGKINVRRANTVPKLLAARRLIDDPRSAWRTVAGVTLATFVAGVLSIAPAIAAAQDANSDNVSADLRYLPIDLMTGAIVTLVIAALLAAVSSGVNQAARIYDQRDQYRMLHLAGTDVSVLENARLRETWLPLISSVLIAAVVAVIMVAPFGVALIGMSQLGPLMFIGGVVVSVAMVMGAVRLSQPLVGRVALGERA
ncbi:hypothetical protein [Microlunatus soli]|uniref:FtsX-like permease family protein n=1 Tax=Microlunatus soli TaxID=630515 RepID=A0A1H1W8P0_9ACTN|nr:hypothetical protein [Microlunatus soli]SDS93587.1 hypothetical protein SAMN04489812_3545 [Microlunatus soli]